MNRIIFLLLISPYLLIAQQHEGNRNNLEHDPFSNYRWMVNGMERKAWVYMPTIEPQEKAPLVFVWHGHGGNATRFLRKCPVHKFWPRAIVVYPQGINSKSPRDLKAERTGWQNEIGDYNDRDLDFFDKMMTYFTRLKIIDRDKVHSAGSSNGGSFTYILLQMRPDTFASVAPAITANIGQKKHADLNLSTVPIFHITGQKEYGFFKQKKLIEGITKNRNSTLSGVWQNWKNTRLYKSSQGDLVWYVHPEGHRWRTQDTALLVDFFKSYPAN